MIRVFIFLLAIFSTNVWSFGENCEEKGPSYWCSSIEIAKKCDKLNYCQGDDATSAKSLCGFCIWTFNKIHELLQKNSTELDVQQFLLEACSLLPSEDIQEKCVQEVNANINLIYNLIRDSLDPGIICRVLKICHDSNLKLILNEQKIKASTKFN
jgi:hypothetical protein